MVSAIIPAYNEESTIGEAVKAVVGHPRIEEVIVVDDGSKDGTSRIAAQAGAKVIRLSENSGKANAMEIGVKAAKSDIILFLDADVLGMTYEKLSVIIDPVVSGRLDMHVGIFARPLVFSKKLFYISPVLSGQRALVKSLWYKIPANHKKGFRIELALNYAARRYGKGTGYEIVPSLRHFSKEEKYGFFKGFWRRLRMFSQVAAFSLVLYIWEPMKAPFASVGEASKEGRA
ncbi:MAG: glycosyltransferase family 2 protein [Candidatus Taylorbacteria bacterium]|nr:glycosyltransferase family 2 protein [Candidatus Taylorbacteria bacterium]